MKVKDLFFDLLLSFELNIYETFIILKKCFFQSLLIF
jgi:hypothetical protein